MANVLNTFFSTIGPKINADMHKLAAPSFESCKLNINGFRFEQIDESIVSRMLLSLSKWWYGANSYLYVQTDRQIYCRPINLNNQPDPRSKCILLNPFSYIQSKCNIYNRRADIHIQPSEPRFARFMENSQTLWCCIMARPIY